MSVIIVAGGTGGLGAAVSHAFLEDGATVVATYQSDEEFQRLLAALGERRHALEGERVDVTDEAAVQRLIEAVRTRHGRIDALVNTVGGYAGGVELWRLETSTLDHLLALNVRAFLALSRAVVPVLLAQRRGAIVNVLARAAIDHPAGQSAYAATKAAALAMTDCLAAELRGSGARVNSILPSIIDTPANRRDMPHASFAQWPKPEEIAEVIRFLCSDQARVIHGAAIPVYGAH